MEKIDEVRSYWNKRPCNLKHSKKTVGTEEYFNEVEFKKYYVESHIPGFADFKRWKGKRVLEIGCGLGTESINFAKTGAQVTAVELSEGSADLAKKRAEVFGLTDKITFYQGNAEELCDIVPFIKYDLIWSFGVIHHTPNPERVIENIRSLMHPETELRIMVYYQWSWKVFWILMTFGKGSVWKINLIPRYSEAQIGCPVTHLYTKRSVKKLLKGLKIKECRVEHIFPWKFPEYKDNIYKKVWYFKWLPDKVFKWLETKIGWHLCITATL